MSKAKQIEEMANIIRCKAEQLPRCPHTTCSICKATELYNADYRKASEVAWEIFEEMIQLLSMRMGIKEVIAELKKKYTEEGK